MITVVKDTFAVEDCFSAASFTQNFAPFFLCGVGYGSSYIFGFFLCEMKFITYFTGVAAAKIIGPHTVLILSPGKDRMVLCKASTCTVLTSLHAHGLSQQPAKDTVIFTHLEM